MKSRKIFIYLFVLTLLAGPLPRVEAQTQNPTATFDLLQKQIQLLLQQVQALQQQIITIQAQLKESPSGITATPAATSTTTETETAPPEEELEFDKVIAKGATGDDVAALQKFLAKDKEIYPERLITGYFGGKTEAALKKFQKKYGVRQDGILNVKTITKIQELRAEGAGKSGVIPPGLLTAPGILKKLATSTIPIATSTRNLATSTSTVPTTVATTTPPTVSTTTVPVVPSNTTYMPTTTPATYTPPPSTTPTSTTTITTTTTSGGAYSLYMSQEDASQAFNCVSTLCKVAQQIVPVSTFTATRVGFKFGGTGNGTVTVSLRNSLDGPVLGTTGILNILTDGSFTEGNLTPSVTLTQGVTYYLQIDSTVPGTVLFAFANGNPYPAGIAYAQAYGASVGWNCSICSNNPVNGDYAFRIYSSSSSSGDTISPSAPTNLTVSSSMTGTLAWATLYWTLSTDNVGVSGYKIYRNGTFLISITPTSTTDRAAYTDANLLPGTTYTYAVAAYDAAGNTSPQSNVVTITTPVPPILTVTSPNGGEQWTVGNTYTITWTSTSTPVSAVNLELYKSSNYAWAIGSLLPNNGSFSWTTPSTLATGNDFKIRISNNMYYNNFDESNNAFSIIVPVTPPSAPPIGYWKFDGNGNNDASGATTSTSAILVGSSSFKPSGGKLGGYLYIPASGDYAKIPHNSIFNLPDAFTIEFWFRQRSNQTFRQDLIYKGSYSYYPYGDVNYWIWRQLWNEYNFGPIQASYVNRDTGYYVGVTNTNQLSHNEWHHVIYTKDSTGSEYYLDGTLIYRTTDSAPARTNTADIIIGNPAPDTDIDNLRIYNYALNRGEVLYNYNSGSGQANLNNYEKQFADILTAFSKLQENLAKFLQL